MNDQIVSKNIAMLVQAGLNEYLNLNPPLTVDGIIGPKTIAAIEQAIGQLSPGGQIIIHAALAAAMTLEKK